MSTNRKPLLIGLTGLAGSGKDTVRAILEEHGFIGLAFADPIKSMVRDFMTIALIDEAYMDDHKLKETAIPQLSSYEKPVSYRMLAQSLGDWGRGIQENFFIGVAFSYMQGIKSMTCGTSPDFVISDVRLKSESDWIKQQGGVVWRVMRPGIAPVRNHITETGVMDIEYDRLIPNTGSIEGLRKIVERAIRMEIDEVKKSQIRCETTPQRSNAAIPHTRSNAMPRKKIIDPAPKAQITHHRLDAVDLLEPHCGSVDLMTRSALRRQSAGACIAPPQTIRPGSQAWTTFPSRIGERLHYPDGRVTTLAGKLVNVKVVETGSKKNRRAAA